tara:strand:+ start:758 stop:1570 length:813 start_codon:yes stop_codon:yes gene_type:complete
MSNRIRARNKKNNALERKIMKTFITAIVSLAFASSGFADNHSSSSEDTNQQALAVETSICTFNDGKDISDMNKAISSFKNWAAGTDYPSYLVMNTPLYVSSQTNADVVLQEFASFENMATAWNKVWAENPKFVGELGKAASCGRSFSHYYPLHNNQSLEPDDDRIMVINWCTKNDGVSWDQMRAKHATFNFSDDIIYWGLMFPSAGTRDGDLPGRFAHFGVYNSIEAFMKAENTRANEGGWQLRADYYASYANCTGTNVYQQTVVSRPAS